MRVRVVTVSDRCFSGERIDASGPLLVELLTPLGEVTGPELVPDEQPAIAGAVARAIAEGMDLVVTTGGTGISARDVTPEAVLPLLDKLLPGVGEAVRARGLLQIPTAVLSRVVAGVAGGTFVVCLPGSTGGVRDGAAVLLGLAEHVRDQLSGSDHPAP